MKKIYITPITHSIRLASENMLALSGDTQDMTIDKNNSLDNSSDMRSRRTIWNANSHTPKGWLE